MTGIPTRCSRAWKWTPKQPQQLPVEWAADRANAHGQAQHKMNQRVSSKGYGKGKQLGKGKKGKTPGAVLTGPGGDGAGDG